jgi:prepilin-type N-terminal cleavage/methylation domain-containing protein
VRRVDREDGFTLVELMITIVIVGVAFAALLDGLVTSITVSTLHRNEATADAVARSAAEWVKDPIQNPYQPCATTSTYTFGGGFSKPAGYSVSITNVQNWNPAPNPIPAGFSPQFGPSGAGCTDNGLQRITLSVQAPNSGATEGVVVMKRAVS